jgi:hypothetical protein
LLVYLRVVEKRGAASRGSCDTQCHKVPVLSLRKDMSLSFAWLRARVSKLAREA